MNQWLKKIRKNRKKGFTLLEMLIVLIVVGILMAIIIPNVAGQRQRIHSQAQVNIAEVLDTQVQTYQMIVTPGSVSLSDLAGADLVTPKQVSQAQKLLTIDETTDLSGGASQFIPSAAGD